VRFCESIFYSADPQVIYKNDFVSAGCLHTSVARAICARTVDANCSEFSFLLVCRQPALATRCITAYNSTRKHTHTRQMLIHNLNLHSSPRSARPPMCVAVCVARCGQQECQRSAWRGLKVSRATLFTTKSTHLITASSHAARYTHLFALQHDGYQSKQLYQLPRGHYNRRLVPVISPRHGVQRRALYTGLHPLNIHRCTNLLVQTDTYTHVKASPLPRCLCELLCIVITRRRHGAPAGMRGEDRNCVKHTTSGRR
jgi:hypothetical protein